MVSLRMSHTGSSHYPLKDNKSLKNGIDSPMMKAMIHPVATIVTQTAQPATVCCCRCIDFSGKIWNMTAREVTRE